MHNMFIEEGARRWDKHVHRGRGRFVYSWILDVLKLKNESTYI
jgi:hypothetical protein